MFQLPGLDYFAAGNGYSGSRGHFNYRIFNRKETMKVVVWYGALCSDRSEAAAEAEFPIDEAGREAMLGWLDGQAKACPREYLDRERIWE